MYEHEWMDSFQTLQFITFEPCENRHLPMEMSIFLLDFLRNHFKSDWDEILQAQISAQRMEIFAKNPFS